MNPKLPSNRRDPHGASSSAFTLIEVLVVIGIIFLLAGLLLPVMSKAKGKARQSECLNNLRQIGIAMQSFSHDHRGRYPMQVPEEDEGSSGGNSEHLAVHTNLSFSTRHFNAIARELGSPKVLACPSDDRRVANSFSELSLENISYWLNIQARPGSSLDYLGGDRNLNLSGSDEGSSRTNQGITLTFTKAIHGYRGNILFADGRVELLRTIQLQPTPVQDVSENPAPVDAVKPALPSDSPASTERNPIFAISDLLENSRRPTNSGSVKIQPHPADITPSPDKPSTNRPASGTTDVSRAMPSTMKKPAGTPLQAQSASRPPVRRDLSQPGIDRTSEDKPQGTLMELLFMRKLGIWLFLVGLILILLTLTWYYLHRKKRGQAARNSN